MKTKRHVVLNLLQGAIIFAHVTKEEDSELFFLNGKSSKTDPCFN